MATTSEIRRAWLAYVDDGESTQPAIEEFDQWLADREAKARAEGAREALLAAADECERAFLAGKHTDLAKTVAELTASLLRDLATNYANENGAS